jgi:large subunit ribosomal protein L18e
LFKIKGYKEVSQKHSAQAGKIFFSRIKMKSKSKIEKQLQRKTNSSLVETIIACKKNKNWIRVAEILSGPRKNRTNLNLEELNKKVEKEKSVVIPGKILSQGELDKKIKVVALSFSEKAKEKLNKAGSETLTILEEIKKNSEAKGIKILEK